MAEPQRKITLDETADLLDKHKAEEGFTFRGAFNDIKDSISETVATGKRKINKYMNQRESDAAWNKSHPEPKKKSGLLGTNTQSLLDQIED